MIRRFGIRGAVGWCALLVAAASPELGRGGEDGAETDAVDFATEVFPALRKNCLACHNATKAKAGLNLESPASMIEGGDSGPALVPGDPDESLVFLSAAHLEEPVMPPAKNKSKASDLNPRELELLRRWIADGAEGESPVAGASEIDWRDPGPPEVDRLPVYHVALGADGLRAAAARGRSIEVYDLAGGAAEAALGDPGVPGGGAHRDFVQSLAFAPDGTLFSGGFRSIKHWRRSVGPERTAGKGPVPSPEVAAVVAGDGTAVFGGADGSVRFVPLGGGDVRVANGAHGAEVAAAAAGGAGGSAVATADRGGRVVMWVAAEARELARFEVGSAVRAVALSPGGELAAVVRADNGHAELWSAADGQPARRVAQLDSRGSLVRAKAVADARAATQKGLVSEREKQRGAAGQALAEQRKNREAAAEAAGEASVALETAQAETGGDEAKRAQAVADAERKKTAADRDLGVAERLLAGAEAELEHATAVHGREVERLGVLEEAAAVAVPGGAPSWEQIGFTGGGAYVVAVAADGSGAVFGAADGRLVDLLEPIADGGRFVGLGAGGSLVYERATVRRRVAWELAGETGSELPGRVTALDVSGDGRWLAAGSGDPSRSGFVGVWEIATGELLWALPEAHSDTVNGVAFSPDGRLVATAGADRMVKVFSAADGGPVAELEGHSGYVTSLDWRADGLGLVSAGTDNTVRLWNPEGVAATETRKDFKRGVSAVAFVGSGGQVLAAAGDPALRLDGEVVFGGGDYLHGVAVDELGETAVAGAHDGVVRVWRLAEKKLVAEFGGQSGGRGEPSAESAGTK